MIRAYAPPVNPMRVKAAGAGASETAKHAQNPGFKLELDAGSRCSLRSVP